MECNLSKDKDHLCIPSSWHSTLRKECAQKIFVEQINKCMMGWQFEKLQFYF